MMDVIEEIIKFRKDLDDAKKEIKGISGLQMRVYLSLSKTGFFYHL